MEPGAKQQIKMVERGGRCKTMNVKATIGEQEKYQGKDNSVEEPKATGKRKLMRENKSFRMEIAGIFFLTIQKNILPSPRNIVFILACKKKGSLNK